VVLLEDSLVVLLVPDNAELAHNRLSSLGGISRLPARHLQQRWLLSKHKLNSVLGSAIQGHLVCILPARLAWLPAELWQCKTNINKHMKERLSLQLQLFPGVYVAVLIQQQHDTR
jgi:hypothetical protein